MIDNMSNEQRKIRVCVNKNCNMNSRFRINSVGEFICLRYKFGRFCGYKQ